MSPRRPKRQRNTRLPTNPDKLDKEQKELLDAALEAHKILVAHDENRAAMVVAREAAVVAALHGGVGPTLIARTLGVSPPIITKIDRRSEART